MGILLHPPPRPTVIGAEENRRFVAFLDACFGRPDGRSLRRDFPTALAEENHPYHYVLESEGRWVSAASALVRDWKTSQGPVRTACVGCFSTPPNERGKGFSRRLQSAMIRSLEAEGVDWLALWTDRPELYAGRGFHAAGQELHGLLTDVPWPQVGADETVRKAGLMDVPAMHALYLRHTLRAQRPPEHLAAHLTPPSTEAFVLERRGRIEAYCCVGKGEDFPGFVVEYGGAADAVHVLWGEARRRGAEQVLVPKGADVYLEGRAEGMRRRIVTAAQVRRSAGAPDPLRCDWAVWGLDSA